MKYALFGYTYQHDVALLLLAKMDVERDISQISQEAPVNHNFDDVHVVLKGQPYFLQVKDFDQVALTDLQRNDDGLVIKGKAHRLSASTNILFFKHIALQPDTVVLGLPAYKMQDVYIISLSRADIELQVNKLYQKDPHRRAVIEQLFAERLDKRDLSFERDRLPAISFYNIRLAERTIKISRKLLEFKDILLIEGKPGAGKSHLATILESEVSRPLVYRFWASNQDTQYEERLKYGNFLSDLSKRLFSDYKDHTEQDILSAVKQGGRTLIIDGLDHVENYNPSELAHFISFLEQAHQYGKTIVLSRPLQVLLSWKKQTLTDWNERQTQKVLKEMYGISDPGVTDHIYQLTGGYPILVRYVAQQYKQDGHVPSGTRFASISDYYDRLLRNEKGKQALALFLCCRGFYMRSELALFLDEYPRSLVSDYIAEHPYLFELRLNRVSLFHDSLQTYLRQSDIDIRPIQSKINMIVCASLLKGEKRFQSRAGHFDLDQTQIKSVVRWYANMKHFQTIMKGVIDFEAVRELYEQVRHLLTRLSPSDLNPGSYYDLALLINLTQRDFIANIRSFQYTYVRSLIFNGYTDEDITSGGYLFAMWYYVATKDASLLLNITSDARYDTADFYNRLDQDLHKENTFFEFQQVPFKIKKIDEVLRDSTSLRYREYVGYILINLYLHEVNRKAFPELFDAIRMYMEDDEDLGIHLLELALNDKAMNDRQCFYVLADAKKDLLAYGIHPRENDYEQLSIKQYLARHGSKGSFTLWPEMLSYLRLALHRQRKADLAAIAVYWTKYHQRHDYTLHAIDQALTVFEQRGWLNWQASVRLISHIQEDAEKGYRGLLARYLMNHEPTFITEVFTAFEPSALHISWFDLEPAWLNMLPEPVYTLEMRAQLHYHRTDRKIPVRDVRNLFDSNKLPLLQRDLKRYNYQLSAIYQDPLIPELKRLAIPYTEQSRDTHDYRQDTAEESFDKGILDHQNAFLIKANRLSPAQVAAYHDGNYQVLADPDLFSFFSANVIRREINKIFFHALTAKSRNGEHFHGVWEMPGTVLSLLAANDVEIPRRMLDSFLRYLELSLLDLSVEKLGCSLTKAI